MIQIETSHGDIIIQLYENEAPLTCQNFLSYVTSGFYNNTLFHRIIDGFIIQGGGFTKDYIPKKSKQTIANESKQGLSNLKGTVGMALTIDKNSASSQFYINLADNISLDYTTKKGRGYTVFAKIIEGDETINKIKKIRTKQIKVYSPTYKRNVPLYDVPEKEVVIKKMTILR